MSTGSNTSENIYVQGLSAEGTIKPYLDGNGNTSFTNFHLNSYNINGDVAATWVINTNTAASAYNFDAYGNKTSGGALPSPYSYNGYYTDSETGFFYLNARYYDPTTQQFTQEDTYWGDGTNLYAYCGGNPVMYSDPSGHYKTVKSGSRGEDVKTLQRILNANGAQLAVDGSFGPKTLAAVKNYQASHGLAVDGSVGPLTWGSLTKSLAPASTSSSSIDDVTDKNLLAYCDNNPIIQTDDSGSYWKELGKGFVDGFVGTFTGIVDALADPLQVIKSVIKTAPLNIADPTGIWRNAYSLGSSIRDKDAYSFGNFTGGKTGEVTILIAMAGSKALSGFFSKGAGKTGIIEKHHLLPQQFKKQFEKAGLDIEKYKIPLDKADHRLKPNGLHTGTNNWNKQWDNFFKDNPNARQDQILNQLDEMKKASGLK